jgi:hypothetical protein
MPTPTIRNYALIALTGASILFSAAPARADIASRAELVSERDALLVSIVQLVESRRESGLANGNDVANAKCALYTFRRDSAATRKEKIANQELLIQLIAENLSQLESRHSVGAATSLEVMQEKGRLLEAKILLSDLVAESTSR